MWVTYCPEGDVERRWEFHPSKVREVRAEMIERRAEKRFAEWTEDFLHGGARARRVLLWYLLTTHEHPNLKFEDVDFARDELTIEMDVSELEKVRENVLASDVDEETRREALAQCDSAIAESREKFGDVEEGKATSATCAPGTHSPSASSSGSAPGSSATS